jgi:23S rRNA G2069 N7-methylase RlmK/C1962 C5-methylase RlmI
VPKEINTLFAKRYKGKKELPIGVSQSIDGKKFVSTITTNYERKTLGLFDTVEEAFSAYKKEKEQYLCLIAEKYKEVLKENVYQAIKNYKIEIND